MSTDAIWINLAIVWAILWWVYAAYQLLIPKDGGSMFEPHELQHERVLQLLIWVILILTAPVWGLIYELTKADDTWP